MEDEEHSQTIETFTAQEGLQYAFIQHYHQISPVLQFAFFRHMDPPFKSTIPSVIGNMHCSVLYFVVNGHLHADYVRLSDWLGYLLVERPSGF